VKLQINRHGVLDLDEIEVELLRQLLKALEDATPPLSVQQERLRMDLLFALPGDPS
jgi:hypothetical protein